MKVHLLVALCAIVSLATVSAKSHHGRQHHSPQGGVITPNPNTEGGYRKTLHHEVTNRFSSPDKEHNHDHTPSLQGATPPPKGGHMLPGSSNGTSVLKKAKEEKNVLHRNAQEHNVNKKQLDSDQEGIMEKEFLIHVTPPPPTARKQKKQAPKRRASKGVQNPSETGAPSHRNKQRQQQTKTTKRTGAPKTGKPHRYPKKYNAQNHKNGGSKKKQKGDKNKDKRDNMSQKMKQKRRDKRNKKIKGARNNNNNNNNNKGNKATNK